MNADSAISWLQIEGFNQWRLFRVDGSNEQKVSEFEENEDQGDALQRLSKIIPLQSPGKYVLKGWKGKNRQASQSLFQFDVSRQSVTPAGSQSHDVQDIYDKAKKAAYWELKLEMWMKEVDSRLEKLESGLKDVQQTILDLNDDDDENDADALTRVSEAATKIPQIAKGFSAITGMFQKTA